MNGSVWSITAERQNGQFIVDRICVFPADLHSALAQIKLVVG